MAQKSIVNHNPVQLENPHLHHDPHHAADELDATMYFLHRRYSGIAMGNIPQLPHFFINRLEVKFSEVSRIVIEKNWEKNIIEAIAPSVSQEKEDEKRAELLTQFSPLLVRCQIAALGDIYQMLRGTLNEDGKKILLQEYHDYRRSLELHKEAPHKSGENTK
jgi:hypothetical protein